jgi:uncharacterized protein (DUF2141 family)
MPRLSICLATLGACSTPSGPPQPYVATVGQGSGAAPDEISVVVKGLRSDAGTVRCFLYNDESGFPDSEAHIVARAVALPTGHAGTCTFTGVGRDHDYAVVILHDENNDNIFQKNALGMPEEGYGFSNDARARFSAPSYADCKFHFGSGALSLSITTRY